MDAKTLEFSLVAYPAVVIPMQVHWVCGKMGLWVTVDGVRLAGAIIKDAESRSPSQVFTRTGYDY